MCEREILYLDEARSLRFALSFNEPSAPFFSLLQPHARVLRPSPEALEPPNPLVLPARTRRIWWPPALEGQSQRAIASRPCLTPPAMHGLGWVPCIERRGRAPQAGKSDAPEPFTHLSRQAGRAGRHSDPYFTRLTPTDLGQRTGWDGAKRQAEQPAARSLPPHPDGRAARWIPGAMGAQCGTPWVSPRVHSTAALGAAAGSGAAGAAGGRGVFEIVGSRQPRFTTEASLHLNQSKKRIRSSPTPLYLPSHAPTNTTRTTQAFLPPPVPTP